MPTKSAKKQNAKATAWPNEKRSPAPSYIGVSIVGGHADISDYSHSEDADALVALLGALGIAPQGVRESPCG